MNAPIFQDLLAALAVVINGIPQGLIALSFGFAAFPTAIAFVIGAAGSLAFNSVATISFQAETITLAGKMGRDIRERLTIVFWGGFFLFIPSCFGLNELIVSFIGNTVVCSMMAGVGLMLAYVSIEMLNSEKLSGSVSMVTAVLVWFLTKNLLYTIIVSVFASTVAYNVLKAQGKVTNENLVLLPEREKFSINNIEFKIWQYPRLLTHALALACLNIGANISFGKITGSIANVNANIDHLAIYSSLADMVSSFFGGGPVESIISGTATAPNPVRASVIMMLLMAAILLLKLLPVIGRYVHTAAIAGFLFVLGAFVTFATDIQLAIASAPAPQGIFGASPWGMIIAATTIISARWNPFFGLLAGLAVRFAFGV